MRIVGDKLREWGLSCQDNHTKDLFRRSAYNRYYYAAFLITREMFSDFGLQFLSNAERKKYSNPRHSSVESKLDRIKNKINEKLKQQEKNLTITKAKSTVLESQLELSIEQLKSILPIASKVREKADYKPDIMEFRYNKNKQNKVLIKLNDAYLDEAKDWPQEVQQSCDDIKRVWNDAGF